MGMGYISIATLAACINNSSKQQKGKRKRKKKKKFSKVSLQDHSNNDVRGQGM